MAKQESMGCPSYLYKSIQNYSKIKKNGPRARGVHNREISLYMQLLDTRFGTRLDRYRYCVVLTYDSGSF